MEYGFTFNGIHSTDMGVVLKNPSREIISATRDQYEEIPGRHGSYLFPNALSDRTITLDCYLTAADLSDLRQHIRNMAAWLYTNNLEPLEFDDEPGIYYLAKLSGKVDLTQILTLGQFTLTFRCEPLAYGPEQQVSFVSDTAIVNNSGTFETLPDFKATFTAAASEWKVAMGSKYLRVVQSFVAGDILEVNCATGLVLVNGVRAMPSLDWQYSEFFALPVGESTLVIAPTGVCTATVLFMPRYL